MYVMSKEGPREMTADLLEHWPAELFDMHVLFDFQRFVTMLHETIQHVGFSW